MVLRNAGRREGARGAAAAELAVVLPLLALMLAAAIDFGRAYHAAQVLEDCAHVGGLYASGAAQTSASPGRVEAARTAARDSGASLSPPLETTDVEVTEDASGETPTVTVTVTYDFRFVTPILVPGRVLTLRRSSTLGLAPRPGD